MSRNLYVLILLHLERDFQDYRRRVRQAARGGLGRGGARLRSVCVFFRRARENPAIARETLFTVARKRPLFTVARGPVPRDRPRDKKGPFHRSAKEAPFHRSAKEAPFHRSARARRSLIAEGSPRDLTCKTKKHQHPEKPILSSDRGTARDRPSPYGRRAPFHRRPLFTVARRPVRRDRPRDKKGPFLPSRQRSFARCTARHRTSPYGRGSISP